MNKLVTLLIAILLAVFFTGCTTRPRCEFVPFVSRADNFSELVEPFIERGAEDSAESEFTQVYLKSVGLFGSDEV